MKSTRVAVKRSLISRPTLSAIGVMLVASSMLSACGAADPDSPVAQRKAIFKQMLKVSEDTGGMLRGRLPFDGAKFAEGAVKLDALSRQPWAHFPVEKTSEPTSAKAAVWERQARFQELAAALEARTGELVVATRTLQLNPANMIPPMNNVEDACDACHKAFRDH